SKLFLCRLVYSFPLLFPFSVWLLRCGGAHNVLLVLANHGDGVSQPAGRSGSRRGCADGSGELRGGIGNVLVRLLPFGVLVVSILLCIVRCLVCGGLELLHLGCVGLC